MPLWIMSWKIHIFLFSLWIRRRQQAIILLIGYQMHLLYCSCYLKAISLGVHMGNLPHQHRCLGEWLKYVINQPLHWILFFSLWKLFMITVSHLFPCLYRVFVHHPQIFLLMRRVLYAILRPSILRCFSRNSLKLMWTRYLEWSVIIRKKSLLPCFLYAFRCLTTFVLPNKNFH